DDHRWRVGIRGQRRWIDHGHAVLRRKPQRAVARANAGGPLAAVALRVEHAVAAAVRDGREFRAHARGDLVELLPAHAIDAAVAAHPQPPLPVVEYLERARVEEPVTRRVVGELTLVQARDPAVVRADPEDAVAVLVKRADGAARQPVGFGPLR